jgi:15-cis-phytoene synthase
VNAPAASDSLLQRGARSFAWIYSDPDTRVILQSLFDIETEIRSALRPGTAHQVSHVRLEWWSAEVERAAAGNPVHPLTRAMLGKLADSTRLSRLSGFINTAVWDLAAAPFGTRAEIAGYCERWASAMLLYVPDVLTNIARDGSARNEAAWLAIGANIREIELLTDLASEAHAGRLRLPLDELEQAGVDPEALAKPPWPETLCAVLRRRHQALRASLAAGAAALPRDEQMAMRGLLVWAGLAARRSQRAERALPNPSPDGPAANFSEAWTAWRLARRASRGAFRTTVE